VIVVVGSPVARDADGRLAPSGLAAEVALAAAAAGATVQLVGKVGDDDAGDAILVALAAAGVRHAATLRDPSNATPAWTPTTADAGAEAGAAEGPLADEETDEEPGPGLPPGLALEAADVDLALRYLADFRVIVLAADLDPATVRVALGAAGYAGAHAVRLDPAAAAADQPTEVAEVTVLAPPPGGSPAFAAFVGRYAAGLDAGTAPDPAFRSALAATDWQRASSD